MRLCFRSYAADALAADTADALPGDALPAPLDVRERAACDEAAKLWQTGGVHIELDHIEVRWVDFMHRDHRVIAVEKITDAELAPYRRARRIAPLPAGSPGGAPVSTPPAPR